MADIVIHHCKLRVVRQGGWSWGAEPQRFLQSAVRTLPDLLARQLAGLWENEYEGEFAALVRITIPVRMSELLAVDTIRTDGDSTAVESSLPAIHTRLAQTLRATFLGDRTTSVDTGHSKHRQPRKSQSEETDVSPELRWSGTVLRLLISWREQCVLATRLEFWSLPSLESWYKSLCTASSQPRSGNIPVLPEAIHQVLRDIEVTFQTPALDRPTILRRWLVMAVEIVHQLRALPGDPVVQQALSQVLPFSTFDVSNSGAEPTLPILAQSFQKTTEDAKTSQSTALHHVSQRPVPQHRQRLPLSSAEVLYEGEIAVASALPFLLVGPLARLGYLHTLTAVLEAADLLPQLPLFATAFAHKVLDPPERGWRRHPAASVCAASFAALAEPTPEPELAEFAQQVSEHLSPLDAVLADALVTGHDPQQPLLLSHTEPTNGLLIVDTEGIFPIAWAETLDSLLPILTRCQASHLLVPQAAADVQLLDRLDTANLRFVTDAPPTRSEAWRSLWHPASGRWWTNDTSTAVSQLVKAAQLLADTSEETATLWRMLAVERPSIPTASGAALDQSLTLAAATALGTIAWTLWREREPVAPYLTLERFRDLDARVQFSRESVRVRLPLGRRYRDLYEHDLLRDVRDVPWLDGRVLQFSGG